MKSSTKHVWGPSGYIGEKSRSDSVDQYSDSSSTTSSVGSGSASSGKIVAQSEVSWFLVISLFMQTKYIL